MLKNIVILCQDPNRLVIRKNLRIEHTVIFSIVFLCGILLPLVFKALRQERLFGSYGVSECSLISNDYSGSSRWVTYYRCFDKKASDIEAVCTNGITLLYGSRHRKDDEEPKVKSI